jgi:hypothetical protein
MDNKEFIYDQFFGENTMNYVEIKNRTTGEKRENFHEYIYFLVAGNILMDTSTDEYFQQEIKTESYFNGNNNQQSFYNPPGRIEIFFFYPHVF